MSSPQVENGYVKIANELMEAFARFRISGEARQVLDVILRKTYGFNKKEDAISLSQFTLATGLKKPNICRAIQKLVTMSIIIKNDNDTISTYRFIKDYSLWKPLSKKIISEKSLSKKIMGVIKNDNLSLSKMIHTKETSTKETSTKEKRYSSEPKNDSELSAISNNSGKPTIQKQSITYSDEKHGFIIPSEFWDIWVEAYQLVDVVQEVDRAAAWVMSNPTQKKKNWARFLNNWLTKTQNASEIKKAFKDSNKR